MTVTNIVTQNGNTTAGWILSARDLTNHELLIQRHESGDSGIKLDNIMSRINPNRYEFRITVVGPNAVAFRISFNPA
jgi:hypothetical protein